MSCCVYEMQHWPNAESNLKISVTQENFKFEAVGHKTQSSVLQDKAYGPMAMLSQIIARANGFAEKFTS